MSGLDKVCALLGHHVDDVLNAAVWDDGEHCGAPDMDPKGNSLPSRLVQLLLRHTSTLRSLGIGNSVPVQPVPHCQLSPSKIASYAWQAANDVAPRASNRHPRAWTRQTTLTTLHSQCLNEWVGDRHLLLGRRKWSRVLETMREPMAEG